MNILDYYEVVTSKIFKLESMNEGLVLIAPEQEVDGVRSLMVGLYVPEHERYNMYIFRSSMNEGELSDKYKAMVCTMNVLKPDWDRIRKKRRKRTQPLTILQDASYFKIIFRKHKNKLEFPCISRRFLLPLRMQIIKQ